MLADQDRIFTNLYGTEPFSLEAARRRGDRPDERLSAMQLASMVGGAKREDRSAPPEVGRGERTTAIVPGCGACAFNKPTGGKRLKSGYPLQRQFAIMRISLHRA